MEAGPSLHTSISTIVHHVHDHTLSLEKYPAPVPTPSQYLIQVHATTFTAGELDWPEPNALSDPIPGFDLAGTIISTPSDPAPDEAKYLEPGTNVYGLTSFPRHGNARLLTVASHEELAPIPSSLDFTTAASIPLSALTAWQALFDHAGLIPSQGANTDKRVLVTAASGGVGIWLVQIASWAGVHVTGTCSSTNSEFVKSLGAADVLDYKNANLKSWVDEDDSRLFDIVLDCVGGGTLEQAWTVVKDSGFLASIVLPPHLKKPKVGVHPDVRSFFFIVKPSGKQLEQLGQLLVEGKIKPQVDSTWDLIDFQKAWDRVKAGHVSGKVVLRI